MWRWACAIALLAACRFNFDPFGGGPSDGATSGDDGMMSDSRIADATSDATGGSPVVQTVHRDTPTSAAITINGATGLAPVTAGNMVVVVCGGLNLPVLCGVTSTPGATWQNIDPGTTLGVYVLCNAPAITSITASNGGTALNLVVTEFSGTIGANCFDQKRISTACAAAPTTWNTGQTPTVSQARELLVAVGYAGSANAGWTVNTPYQIATDATGINANIDVLVGYQEVNAAPMAYAATGSIAQWQNACFTDVFTFKQP